jgi:hypothetical protein
MMYTICLQIIQHKSFSLIRGSFPPFLGLVPVKENGYLIAVYTSCSLNDLVILFPLWPPDVPSDRKQGRVNWEPNWYEELSGIHDLSTALICLYYSLIFNTRLNTPVIILNGNLKRFTSIQKTVSERFRIFVLTFCALRW